MRLLTLFVFAAILLGCATSSIINSVELGMTKSEVVAVMGDPVSVSAKGATEYLNYALSETSDDAYYGFTTPYYVRLVNGRVDAYWRSGDFDSTQPTTIRLETDELIKLDEDSDLYTELRKLKQLHDEGILSDAEYEELKQKAIRKY